MGGLGGNEVGKMEKLCEDRRKMKGEKGGRMRKWIMRRRKLEKGTKENNAKINKDKSQ